MKRFTAIVFACILALLCTACTDKKDQQNTTTTENGGSTALTTAGNNAQESTSATQPESSTAPETSEGETTTQADTGTTDPQNQSAAPNGQTTTDPAVRPTEQGDHTGAQQTAGKQAPVNGSVAEILTFYNAAANNTKQQKNFTVVTKGKLDCKIKELITTNKLVISGANKLLESLFKDEEFTETFKDGKGTQRTDKTPNTYLPVKNQDYMSKLTPADVLSASCTPKGDGWEVKIVIKEETVSPITPPPMHYKGMDTMDKEINLADLPNGITIHEDAKATYLVPDKSQMSGAGRDYSVRGIVNKNGTLDEYSFYEPLLLFGQAQMYVPIWLDVSIEGYFISDITFTYN